MKPMLSIIIVGINGWEEYTRPLINGIWAHEPDAELVVVDNASTTPYPKGEHIHRSDKRMGYAEALNFGIERAGNRNWYVVMNNDVEVRKAFTGRVEGLDPSKIYGFKFWEKHPLLSFSAGFVSSWCMFISREVWKNAGKFDTEFTPMYFEDVDYCLRAKALGIELVELNREDWGIIHLYETNEINRIQFKEEHRDRIAELAEYLRAKHGIN